ncbi:hypothetical protein RRG08_012091 [Elysia crispata]|uniref:Uncharacterized protein n=1 Tax=Elysia crispata TaxID=231223 RepID=A0AAE0YVK5_9GAST|nr:hypothetical protein RRG08_012091 [Elysia crispata]
MFLLGSQPSPAQHRACAFNNDHMHSSAPRISREERSGENLIRDRLDGDTNYEITVIKTKGDKKRGEGVSAIFLLAPNRGVHNHRTGCLKVKCKPTVYQSDNKILCAVTLPSSLLRFQCLPRGVTHTHTVRCYQLARSVPPSVMRTRPIVGRRIAALFTVHRSAGATSSRPLPLHSVC